MTPVSIPRVSVGMPVYNGAAYLEAAIESVLSQTMPDLELIISDNASTDDTEQICRAAAQRDQRVRYLRLGRNVGANRNYNVVAQLARAPLFKWAAHDDLCAPTYLERCLRLLDDHPDAVLAHSRVTLIDNAGRPLERRGSWYVTVGGDRYGLPEGPFAMRHLDSADAVARYAGIVLKTDWCFEIFGVIRTDHLFRTTLMGDFYGTDKVILADLALQGRFVEVPEALWSRRCHPQTSSSLGVRQKAAWSSARQRARPPVVDLTIAYFTLPLREPLSTATRLRALGVAVRKMFSPEKVRRLVVPGPDNYLGIGGHS